MVVSKGSGIQNLAYTYDVVGNITALFDNSNTDTQKTVAYTYDSLNRLLTASTTVASTSPYLETYAYDALGNLTAKTGQGAYLYAGNTGSLYANPHAPTSINGLTAAYDQDGNLMSYNGTTNAWDYRNRLTASYASSSPTTYYTYDHTMERVQKGTGLATTTYVSKYYEVGPQTASTTKYVFSPSGELLATVLGSGATTTGEYIHADNLGGINVKTNSAGSVVRTQDYYPYGADRVNAGTAPQNRDYIGQVKDQETTNLYLHNRYYNPGSGQFLTEDPVFWAQQNLQEPQSLNSARTMGGSNSGFASGWNGNTQSRGSSISQLEYLADPQMQNSYSYARDNPISLKDPNGDFAVLALPVYAAWTAPEWVPAVITSIGLAATYIAADIAYRSNPGQRYIPFNQQGREVQLPGVPDPLNPWGGWKPGPPGDWKTWVGAGLSGAGLAADLYKQYQDYRQSIQQFAPSNQNTNYNQYVVQGNSTYLRTSGGGLAPTSLPATVSQGGATYYRNSSGLLSTQPGL